MKTITEIKHKDIFLNQILLNIFGFFLALPVIDIFGLSITLYIFLLLILSVLKNGQIIFKIDKTALLLFGLFISGLISTLIHPPLVKEISPFLTLKIIMQFFYWIVLTLFIKTYISFINFKILSKYIFFGLLISIVVFYYFPLQYNNNVISINFKFMRNAFVYNILAFFPLIFWYISKSHFKNFSLIIIIFFIISILFSGGRAGFFLILFQFLLLLSIIFIKFRKYYLLISATLIIIFSMWFVSINSPFFDFLSKKAESINPRAASLINKSGVEGDLTMDRSWLLRKLMVNKALEISKEYPLFGIGWFNFINFETEIESQNEYERMQGIDKDFLNTRSAHNSYAQYLAECGIIGLFLLIIIFLIAIKNIFYKIPKGNFNYNDLPLIAFFTLMIYFYAISSLYGANTFLLLGLNLGINENYKKLK